MLRKKDLPEEIKAQQEQLDRLMSKDSMIDRLVIEALLLSLSMITNPAYQEDIKMILDKKNIKTIPIDKNTPYLVSQCLRIRYSYKENELKRLLFARSTSITNG